MLIVPDIHGRSFWHEPVLRHFSTSLEATDANERKVVFLGDYLDPYPRDHISTRRALKELEMIIDLKKQQLDDVVLLLGNHDLAYISPDIFTAGRHDDFYEDEAHQLFYQNLSSFNFLHSTIIAGRRYLFSHAGILPEWAQNYHDTTELSEIERVYSRMFEQIPTCHLAALQCVSYLRGGREKYGSFVWADAEEFKQAVASGYYQIFGHTQQMEQPIITDDYACLDCREVFSLGQDGKLSILD